MRFVWTGCKWDICQNINTWDALDKSSIDDAVFLRKVASGLRVAGATHSPVNARDLQIALQNCRKHCLYLFLYMTKTMIWKEEERSIIRAVQMDNLRFVGYHANG